MLRRIVPALLSAVLVFVLGCGDGSSAPVPATKTPPAGTVPEGLTKTAKGYKGKMSIESRAKSSPGID